MKTISLISIAAWSLIFFLSSVVDSESAPKPTGYTPFVSDQSHENQQIQLPDKVFKRPAAKRSLKVCLEGCTFSSIGSAIKAAQHGEEIVVAPGMYAEHPSVIDKRTSDRKKWLTIRSEIPFAAKIVNNNRHHVLEILNSNNIWLEGFDVSSQPYWTENTQNNFGIFVNTSTNIRIINNFVHHVGCSGIQANTGDNYAIIGNIVSTVTRNEFCSGISLWENERTNPKPLFKKGEINTAYDVHYYVANNVILDAVQLNRKGKYLQDISDGNGIILDHHKGQKKQAGLAAEKRSPQDAHYLVENNVVGFCGLRGYHSLTPNGHFRNNLSVWSSRTPANSTVQSATRAEFSVGTDGTSLCGNIGIARYEHDDGDEGPNVGLGFFGYGEDNPPTDFQIADNVMYVHGNSLHNRSRLSLEEKTGTSYHDWTYGSWRDLKSGKKFWNKADRLANISQAASNYYGQDPGIEPESLMPLLRYGQYSQLENGKNNPLESKISYDPLHILGDFYFALSSLKAFEVNRCEGAIWDIFGNKRKPKSIAGPFSHKGLNQIR